MSDSGKIDELLHRQEGLERRLDVISHALESLATALMAQGAIKCTQFETTVEALCEAYGADMSRIPGAEGDEVVTLYRDLKGWHVHVCDDLEMTDKEWAPIDDEHAMSILDRLGPQVKHVKGETE
jgi:hypothetical protein